ncbi:glycoside hydrolase family 2 TIM barrel-domain containing protein [Carboxylicivirga taeanensis]|uniref:glycoside hydrolase family 2 TIM barrel-domain containing protein n=1 Tax=Carboxylicivirga taeanensis TaxID=1416875 RepID=UPI003F6E0D97
MKKLLLTLFVISQFGYGYAQVLKTSFNEGWFFKKGTGKDSIQVILPHHWNDDAYINKNYYRGIGEYSKRFVISETSEKTQQYLYFEGVNSKVDVVINDNHVLTHSGGYTGFYVHITPHLKYNSSNDIRLVVDNTNDNLAPLSGDFTIFGGVYRPVWLIEKNEISFELDSLGGKGLLFAIDEVSDKQAKGVLQLSINNTLSNNERVTIEIHGFDPQKQAVFDFSVSKRIKRGSNHFEVTLPTLKRPMLWSPEEPNLYTLDVVLKTKNGKVLDQQKETIGWRWFEVGANNALFLNGKPIKLMGASRHQDRKGYGIALSDVQHTDDIKVLKSMGANFIRLAHYPQSEAVLDACDKYGLLVWEEVPVVDLVNDNQAFFDNAERQLREMVRQHFNHPSVVMWGYMNEAIIQVPHRIKDSNERKERYAATVRLAKQLEGVCKTIDPNRLTVMAYHGTPLYNEIGLAGITDISGWNLYDGWYGGGLKGFETFVSKQHQEYPERALIISEFGAGSDKRIHTLKPRKFDFSIEYQQLFMEHYWPVIRDSAYIMGGAMWNLVDFSSALRNESMPRINNKGLMYSNRELKDVFFYQKAFLSNNTPVLHLATRDWQQRVLLDSDSKQAIKVYSNLKEVELQINEVSFGKKETKNCTAQWEVELKEGTHNLSVRGLFNGEEVKDFAPMEVRHLKRRISENNTVDICINAGSDAYFHADGSSLVFMPDRPYEKGSWGYINGEAMERGDRPGTTAEIKGTQEDPLFQTRREGEMAYRFDVEPGTYELTLGFADLNYYGQPLAYDLGNGTINDKSISVFNIALNGQELEVSFSPAKLVGGNHALLKTYVISTDQPFIEVKLTPVKGQPYVNSLRIKAK